MPDNQDKVEPSDNRRNRTRVKKFLGPHIDLNYKEGGVIQCMRARIVDTSDGGVGLSSAHALSPGTQLSYVNESSGEPVSARVAWCHKSNNGDYRVGLRFGGIAAADSHADVDYYELLQVNAKADPDTIHRVYRILAQRHHPDNKETGDATLFRQLLEAYGVLSDPEQRAVYDLRHHSIRKHQWKVFEKPAASQGAMGEKQKRRAVLFALYMKRLRDNHSPMMAASDIEDLLSIPKEHLEFTIWYLREHGLVARTDNNRFAITAKGVDAAEAMGDPTASASAVGEDRMLESA
jgi:DnaJ domain/PilZ domain